LEAPEALALCPVCWWEDDGQDGDLGSTVADEVRSTVNGDLSFNQARQNYLEYGAAHSGFMRFVRQPTPEEQ